MSNTGFTTSTNDVAPAVVASLRLEFMRRKLPPPVVVFEPDDCALARGEVCLTIDAYPLAEPLRFRIGIEDAQSSAVTCVWAQMVCRIVADRLCLKRRYSKLS